MASSLRNAMAALNRAKRRQRELDRQDYREAKQAQRKKVTQLRETTKRLEKSKAARAVSGFAKGFASGLSLVPVAEDKKETFGNAYQRQYMPDTSSKLQKAINKARKERDAAISKTKAGRYGATAGNIAGTVTGALLTSGATKAIAGKALGTNAAKKVVGKASEKLTQKALRDKAGQTVTRKLLERVAQASGRKTTETALRNASRQLTGKIAENIAQDVAYDATFGAAKDVSRYVESGRDPRKNPADFAKYMAGNAAQNTLYGAIGNVILPGIGAYRRGKAAAKLTPQRVRSVRQAGGEAADIISPKLKGTVKGKAWETVKRTGDDGVERSIKVLKDERSLKDSVISQALNNGAYVSEIRAKGINGKSVRQAAADEGKSVSEIIAEDYAKRYGNTVDTYNRINRTAASRIENVNAGKTATGNAVINRPKPVPDNVVKQIEATSNAGKELQNTARVTAQTEQSNAPTQAANTPTVAANTPTNTPTSDLDVTMRGTRSGSESVRSQAADTAANARGLKKDESEAINNYMKTTRAERKWAEGNQEAINRVAKRIDEDGTDASVVELRRRFEDGDRWDNEATAETVLLGQRLTGMKRIAEKEGRTELAKKLGQQRDMVYAIGAMEGSEAGKTLQAQKLYNSLTPEGRVNAMHLMGVRMKQKLGVEFNDISEELYDNLRNAKSEAEIQKAKDAIAVAYWNKIPPNLTEKLSAWRYLSMLGNPKTHIRNLVGNTVFMLPRAVSNALATGGEKVFLRNKALRTKAVINPLTDSAYLKKASDAWDEAKDTFMRGSEKYESTIRRPEGSPVFKLKPLQKASDLNTWLLTKEDEVFAGIAYKNAYAGFLKAKGIDPSKATKTMLEKAKEYAWDQALTATYRESNILADALNKARAGASISMREFRQAKSGKEMEQLAISKGLGTLADALVPFAKTPANILKEGLNYSPAGLIRSAGRILKAAASRNADDIIDAIDASAQALTGTGLMALGYFLAENGGVTSSIQSGYKTVEEQLGRYNKDRGEQEYSFMINDVPINKADIFDSMLKKFGDETEEGKTYNVTGDSLVPAAMPFFMGVELSAALGGNDAGESEKDKIAKYANVVLNMTKLADPVLNLSMLSSVQNAFNTWQSSSTGRSPLGTFLENSLQSRLGQYVPTVGGQVVNTMRDAKPSATAVRSGLAGRWESFLRQQANKIPGVTNVNADKSDAFGQKVDEKKDKSAETYLKSGAKNFLSPFNIREMRKSPADTEIQRLIKEEGQAPNGLLPETQNISDINKKFGDKKFDITQKDVAAYNENHGQYALKQINKLLKTEQYKKATAEQKASLIKDIYYDAKKYANEQLARSKGMSEREIMLNNLEEYWVKIDKKEEYLAKEEKLKSVGIGQKASMKMWDRVETAKDRLRKYNANSGTSPGITLKTLAALEGNGGKLNKDQAKAATNAYESTLGKATNLYKAGFTVNECAKLVLNDDEQKKLAYYTKSGTKRGIDSNKLKLYINRKKLSRRQKWACYELNHTDPYGNPFTY